MFTKPTKCPNQDCRFHGGPEGSEQLYGSNRFWIKRGYYKTKHDHRAVPRYSCRAKTGEIIDARVGLITCKHRKADSERRYGKRIDERTSVRREVLESVAMCAKPGATIATDGLRHYRRLITETVPGAKHEAHESRGRRDGCGFDPLFRLNHTCAKLRADIARLRRKTWCISKLASRLQDHLHLYIAWQNGYGIT